MAAATRSNLAIYPINPGGLGSSMSADNNVLGESRLSLQTVGAFRALGEATGGFAVINSNSFTDAFERIVRDNSTYYMLAFNSGYTKDDGKYVRVQVRVKRPGLTVRTRDGYVAPTRRQREAEAQARAKAPAVSAVATALASPLATRGTPIRVFATPFKGRGKNSAVAMAVEVEAGALGLELSSGVLRGQVNVRYLATDAKRNVYPEVSRTASVEVRPDAPGRVPLEKIRVRIVSELDLPPGRYQVRVAAGGSIVAGNVVYDLEVPDFGDGRLAMSGLMLAVPSEPMVLTLNSRSGVGSKAVKCYTELCTAPIAVGDGDVPLTPSFTEPLLKGGTAGSPTTRREFAVGDPVTLVTEVYDNAKRKPKDPPSVISLTAELRGEDGTVVPLASDEQPATLLRDSATGSTFKIYMTMPDVVEGPYALRVQARVNGDDERVVSREILVRVK
jgi:hypothetical protein